MEALVRGSRAPRVSAVCQGCGSSFERSAVHPYIVRCPACRGSKVRAAPAAPAVPAAEAEARLVAACRGLDEASGGSDERWLAALAELRAASLVRANAGT